MPRVLDKLSILVPGFCKHTTMVCFVCSYSACFVGERYHFLLFLPALLFFWSYFFFVKFHDMTRCINFPPPQNHLKFASSTRLGRWILLRLQPSLQAWKNAMNFTILVPRIPLGEILRIGFWCCCDFVWIPKCLTESLKSSKRSGICSTCSFIALFSMIDNLCEADSQAKIPVPLTRFTVNWTPGVLSLEYYVPSIVWYSTVILDEQSLPFANIADRQKLSLHVTSIGRFKGQACSETYEYRNTFSRRRHLSTWIYNRLKAIISGKPFLFTNSLVSSFSRIMFMRLYFRIIFFTSHYCLCSFIITYLSYLVFLSCISYFPKLKGPGSMGWHHFSFFAGEMSLKFLQQPFGFNRGRVSKPPGNTMNSSILVPWIWLGDILRVGFWSPMAVIFTKMLTSDQTKTPHSANKRWSCFLLKEWEATAWRWMIWHVR